MTTQAPSEAARPSPASRAPHPGFPSLVGLHLQSLIREFPVAWIVFGAGIVGLPVLALVADLGLTPRDTPSFGILRIASGIWGAQALTVLVALFWPDAVWRNLPPGGRQPLDALPVDRRWHRLARVLAGFSLPLLMAMAVFLAQVIVTSRLSGLMGTPGADAVAWPSVPEGSLATFPALAAAYLFGSALGIQGMRVILTSLLALLVYAILPPGVLLGLGLEGLANGYTETMVQGTWSPLRTLLLGFRAESADLLPLLGWLAILGVVCHQLAGRHAPQ